MLRKTVGELKTSGLLICQLGRGKLIGHDTRKKYSAVRFLNLKNVQAEGLAARNSGCAQPRAFMRLPAVNGRRPGSALASGSTMSRMLSGVQTNSRQHQDIARRTR